MASAYQQEFSSSVNKYGGKAAGVKDIWAKIGGTEMASSEKDGNRKRGKRSNRRAGRRGEVVLA